MAYSSQIFVSSSCYELRDLRAALKGWLEDRGFSPQMSDDGGFPHSAGMPPYASCLLVLEQCQLVVGVVDRAYGKGFENWGPYPQLKGCSPTHGELRYALDQKKRVLIYVQQDIWNFYEVWRKDEKAFQDSAPKGLELATLEMLHEFKKRTPVPWVLS